MFMSAEFVMIKYIYGRKEENVYLTTHSPHFIYGYVASVIW